MPNYAENMPQSNIGVGLPDDEEQRQIIIRTVNAMRRMRFFRRQYDPRRAYWYRQYLGQRDNRYYPDNLTPRANTFVPYPRSNVETVVSRTMDAFFSIDPPIETRGRGQANEASAENMQLALLTSLHRANWQKALEMQIRNECIYGHAGIKVDWDWDYDTVTSPEPIYLMQPMTDQMTGQPILDQMGQPSLMPVMNPMTGEPIQMGTQIMTKNVPRNRPKLIPIDVFDLIIDPDGGQVCHLMEKTFAQLKREYEQHPEFFIPGAIEELEDKVKNATLETDEKDFDSILIRMGEFWDETHNTVTLITFSEDNDAIAWKDLRYSYRNANYSSYKRRVFAGQPILLQYGPNPFLHKRAPILHSSYIHLTGEVYGIGVVEAISDLSETLNKMVNMVTDNWNLGINRRYAYDSNADIDHNALNQFNVPGGKVAVNGNPNEVIFPLPTMTPTPADYTIMQVIKQMIELGGGISDFYNKGIGGAQGNRTSTGIGQVLTESNYLFKMFIRNFERDILQPMLEMCASNIQQFCGDYAEYEMTQQMPNIPKVGRIPIASIIGNYSFDFVGANYATNKVLRQRNMMAFYQLASQTPYANQGEFLREIGKTMEIPNCARLVKPDQQVMQEQQQAMAAQQQNVLLEKILDTESKMLVAEVTKKKEDDPDSVAHGRDVQEVVEEMLMAAGDLVPQGGPPGPKAKEGRPATRQPEGKIPGSDATGAQRSLAQGNGANALGLGSLGSQGGAE